MILHRLGLINKDQRGLALIDLIVAIAITSAITGGIAMAIFQVFNINTQSSNHMLAVRQVQTAGYWISHDTQMAQITDPDPVDDGTTLGTEVLTLTWVGWPRLDLEDNQLIDSYEVHYTYDDNSLRLWRYQKITTKKYDSDGDLVETTVSPTEGWQTSLIAEHITSISIPPMVDGKLDATIEATVGEAEEQRTYEITPRPGS